MVKSHIFWKQSENTPFAGCGSFGGGGSVVDVDVVDVVLGSVVVDVVLGSVVVDVVLGSVVVDVVVAGSEVTSGVVVLVEGSTGFVDEPESLPASLASLDPLAGIVGFVGFDAE